MNILSVDDEVRMRKSFNDFLNKTGITPSFISISNEEWQGYTSSLEKYAYNRYLNMFNDEKHWLVVYASNGGHESWELENILGNNCDSMIDVFLEGVFFNDVQENLLAGSRFTVGDAISTAFDDIGEKSQYMYLFMDIYVFVFFCSLCAIFIIIGIFICIRALRMKPYMDPRINSEQCHTDRDKPVESVCIYCGGIYVYNSKRICPHCGLIIQER